MPPEDVLWVDEWTPETAPHVVAARRAGRPVLHPAQRLLDGTALPVVAVTGTAGKTSTCHLLDAVLRADGRPPVMNRAGRGGNAWPDGAVPAATAPGTWFLAELTSTHLCYLALRDIPRVAVVTCLWHDHTELHGGFEAYVAAKRRILEGQPVDGWAVLDADDAPARALLGPPRARLAEFSLRGPVPRGVWRDDRGLWGRWDRAAVRLADPGDIPAWAHPTCVVAACAAALACGVDPGAVRAGLTHGTAPPHRMRPVGTVDGVPVVDDAMAATPTKAAAALARFPDRSVVLLAGGEHRPGGVAVHASPAEARRLEACVREAARAARLVVVFGPAADRLAPMLTAASVPHVRAHDLSGATGVARDALRPGDTLLLSPMFPMRQADRQAFGVIVGRDADRGR